MFRYKEILRVEFETGENPEEAFGGSQGLMGSFPDGSLIGRDGVTIINDVNEFGKEWQVLASEPHLFHISEGVQAPEGCEMPTDIDKIEIRRRLGESKLSKFEVETACAHVSDPGERANCLADVWATNDLDMAGGYY